MTSKSESGAGGAHTSGRDTKQQTRDVRQRKAQFLVAPRRHAGVQMMGVTPLSFSVVEQALRDAPDIEIIGRVGPRQVVGGLGVGLQEGAVLVTLMAEDKAQALAMQAQGQLIVERDQPLQLLDVNYPQLGPANYNLPSTANAFRAEIQVLGDGQPVRDAEVYLYGGLLPAQGITDAQGKVQLTLPGESAASIRRLYIKPRMDYWSFCQDRPDMSETDLNLVGLRALSDWPPLKNFPRQQQLSWGQRAMRIDQVPGTYRGQGVKIAIIDSGCANEHQDLTHVSHGYDIVNKATNANSWNVDTIAHGTHCAGVIAGLDSASGIRGFAPDAEIHACKLFPGGQVSQLIDALEYCIEHQIDVVNLSLGGAEPSEALEQQIIRARQAGIACIVAAGNSSGPVQYPGASPNVLAVAAIGRINEFPSDSYHMQAMTSLVDANGFFSARFSCFGPEIAVCAPGVAITSSVPDNNFAAWDGTSMAAPHVTGLAALVLAHHPDFQGAGRTRSADRVERLFQIIKMSCQPLLLGDQRRTGFGLPDAPRAVGLAPAHNLAALGTGLGASLGPNLPAAHAGIGSLLGGVAPRDFSQAYRDLQAMQAQNAALGRGLGLASLDPYLGYLAQTHPGLRYGIW